MYVYSVDECSTGMYVWLYRMNMIVYYVHTAHAWFEWTILENEMWFFSIDYTLSLKIRMNFK